jgi:hypothetical protein
MSKVPSSLAALVPTVCVVSQSLSCTSQPHSGRCCRYKCSYASDTTPRRKLPFHLCGKSVAIGCPVARYIRLVVVTGIPARRPVCGISTVGAVAVTGGKPFLQTPPVAIFNRIEPTYSLNRAIAYTRKVGWIGTHHGLISCLSKLVFIYVKAGDSYIRGAVVKGAALPG